MDAKRWILVILIFLFVFSLFNSYIMAQKDETANPSKNVELLSQTLDKNSNESGQVNKLRIKKIELKGIFKTFFAMSGIVGCVIGIFTVFPVGFKRGLGFGGTLLAWIIFTILYALIITLGILIVIRLYNLLAPLLGYIIIVVE